MRSVSRREFLGAAWGASLALGETVPKQAENTTQHKTLDVHVHLVGIGDSGSGCRLSREVAGKLAFKILTRRLGVWRRAHTFDEGYVLALAELLRSSCLDQAAVMGMDAVYDRGGRPDWCRTSYYVPNDYVLQVAGRFPQCMVPCVSINPDRADAIDELERCVQHGARGLKILAPVQGVDLAEKRHTGFFRRCAERGVVLITHTGHEHALPVLDNRLGDPRRLELALDQGCTVVACHCATSHPGETPVMLPDYLRMIRKYSNLWGDTAAFGTPGRRPSFLRLLSDEVAVERFIHGSDFPVPCMPFAFRREIGHAGARRLRPIRNPLARDLALKQCFGIGRASAERAHRLLCGS